MCHLAPIACAKVSFGDGRSGVRACVRSAAGGDSLQNLRLAAVYGGGWAPVAGDWIGSSADWRDGTAPGEVRGGRWPA
jgi:hypothetical protein